jgi:polyisoprenoid-binding protein YceI
MMIRYQFDPNRSQFQVQAFAAGMLSFFAHSPTFAVRDFSGGVQFEGGTVTGMRLRLVVNAGSLELLDRVRPADRAEIETRMRREVLEIATDPEIAFESAEVEAETIARGRSRLRIVGLLALHGVTRPQAAQAELVVYDDGIRLGGESRLLLSGYGIRPVTALGGTIRLKDELKVSFDLVGIPEAK